MLACKQFEMETLPFIFTLKLKEGSLPRQRKNAGMSRASTCFERKVRKNGETLGLESHENQRTVRDGFGESLIICSGNNADNFLLCFLLLLVLFLGYHIPSFSYKMNSTKFHVLIDLAWNRDVKCSKFYPLLNGIDMLTKKKHL